MQEGDKMHSYNLNKKPAMQLKCMNNKTKRNPFVEGKTEVNTAVSQIDYSHGEILHVC